MEGYKKKCPSLETGNLKIEFENVSKAYQQPGRGVYTVLKDISLTIDSGDFVVILGESGCGKTTLLNLIAGFDRPSSGRILADSHEIRTVHHSRSMLFQQPALLPWLNVRKNVAYGCKVRGEREHLDYRVHQYLEIMGLSGFETAMPGDLSLGMAQRVCLARALAGSPRLLLMDEPFASLDTFTRAHIQEELVNLWLSEQFSVVFVTHDIDEAILLGTRVVLLGGDPVGIREVFEIKEPYPRNVNSNEWFSAYRKWILKRFKESYVGNRRLL